MITVARTEWGAQHGDGSAIAPSPEVVVHHTVGAPRSSDPAVEALWMLETEADHRSRGWLGIGYSWLIMPSGRVYEGRGWRRSGAHTPGRNSSAHGIAFVGDFRATEPTPEAVEAFRDLVRAGVAHGHIREPVKVTGHRDYRATICPGDRLYAMLPGLLDEPDEPPADPPPPDIRIPREELPGPGWFPALRGIIAVLFGGR
jgi:peptidoglycan recognition protein